MVAGNTTLQVFNSVRDTPAYISDMTGYKSPQKLNYKACPQINELFRKEAKTKAVEIAGKSYQRGSAQFAVIR